MALLTQDTTEKKFYMGWYGNCVENCSNLDLTTLPQAEKERIHRVYQYDSTNKNLQSYTGLFDEFSTLECGIPYLIVLKSGTGSVTIPNFIPTNIGTSDLGRITDNCSSSQLVLSATHTELDEGVYVNNIPYTELSLSTDDGTLLIPGDIHKIKLTGSGITPDDFKWSYWSDEYTYFEFDSSMEADFVVDNNGYADGIILTTKADSTTEGPETVRVILVDDSNVFVDIDINDTSQSPLNLQLTSQFNPLDEGVYQNYSAHTEIELSNVDGTPLPLGSVFPFTISGSSITPDDFVGWGTHDQLYGGGSHTPFDSNLDGILTVDSGGTASIEIKTRADSTTEGPETFTLRLDDYPSVSIDVTINDTSQTPTSYSLHIVDDGYGSGMAEVGDGFPNQKVIELRGFGYPLNTVVPFTISGSGITPDDFIGLDSLGAGEFTLDSAGQGYNFGRVTLTTNADNSTEGTEVFTLYLDEDQSVSVDVTIYDDSQETFPGTLTLWGHSAGAEDPAYSPSMYEPLVNDSTADLTYFIAEISNWSGGQQTLQWEIDQNVVSYTYGIVGADDVQYEPHNPEAYNYNQEFGITINSDGVSGTWPINNTDYSGLRIWVLADAVSEGVEGNARELLRLKVTDENGNVSQVDAWIDERP